MSAMNISYGRTLTGLLAIVSSLVVLGVLPGAAAAATCPSGPNFTVSQAPTNPEVGVPVTLTVSASGGSVDAACDPPPGYAYEFQTTGPDGKPAGTSGGPTSTVNTFTFTPTESGAYNVLIDVFNGSFGNGQVTEQTFPVAVQPALLGSITTAPSGNVLLGSTQTFTANGSLGVPPYTYAWKYGNDPAFTDATGSTIQRLFPNALNQDTLLNGQPFSNSDPTETFPGNPTNTPVATPTAVKITDANGATLTTSVNSGVILPNDLNASITVGSGTVYAGVAQTLSATAAGGVGPYTYAWTINSTASPVLGTGSSITYTFPTAGTYTVQATVTDSAKPHYHALLEQQTVTVQPQPTITVTTPTTCPSGQSNKPVTFGLVHATGCFTIGGTSATPTYTSTSTIHLDNIPITPPSGSTIVLTAPTSSNPGGSISAALAGLSLPLPNGKLLTLIENKLQFAFPTLAAGQSSGEAKVLSIGPAGGVSLFGFKIGGQVTLNFGTDGAGNYYSTFDIELNLPSVFKSGLPSSSNPPGGLMGQVELKLTSSGIDFNGLSFTVSNAYIGDLRLENLCFALIPGGSGDSSSCSPASIGSDTFTAPGSALLSCGTTNLSSADDTWTATAGIVLPTPSSTTIGVFGGGESSTTSGATTIDYLGGEGDNLNIPIAEGVTLNSIGGGICFNPLILTANMGIGMLPVPGKGDQATVNGSLTFDAGTATSPWNLDLKGDVDVFGNQVGSGEINVQQGGDFSFNVGVTFNIGSYVSLDGGLSGWFEPSASLFNIDGNIAIKVSIGVLSASATAEGVASSTGIAGCIGIGSGAFSISAGAGYLWASKQVSLMAGSCSVGAFEATQTADIAAAGGAKSVTVAKGQAGAAWQIHGTSGPPQVVITGPHGFSLHANGQPLQLVKNSFLLIEDPSTNSTDVVLVHPAAGRYTIASADPTTDSIATIQSAHVTRPFAGHGTITRIGKGQRRRLKLAYKLPAGTKLMLVERGAHVIRTLARNVHGTPCGHGSRCFTTTFIPARGPGGKRTIQAVLQRGGIPQPAVIVARFTAPKLTLPAKPAKIQLRRRGTTVTIRWSASRGASKYNVLAQATDGHQSLFVLGNSCRAVSFTNVASGLGVSASVQPVRFDEAAGRDAKATLNARSNTGGTKGKQLSGRLCR
ncbi:MAG TPA: PKD domain-containing protein [Solirubrobacteraceae bacterium]|nr:PKD domain-containing protein [Solirubrobacteraceae bacterium]